MKLKLILIVMSLLLKNIFAMNSTERYPKEFLNLFSAIKQNLPEEVIKISTKHRDLKNTQHPILPIMYCLGTNPKLEMVECLIKQGFKINSDNHTDQKTIIPLIAKIVTCTEMQQRCNLIAILELLLDNGAIVTQEIINQCSYDAEVKFILERYYDNTDARKRNCSLM